MQKRLLLNSTHLDITIRRLCWQLIENHDDFSNSAIIGLQPRGILLARRIHSSLKEITSLSSILYGELDITFYRDDFRRRGIEPPSKTSMDFSLENKKVILVDDVLFTGRTVRAGMDAMLDFGRPSKVELMVLVNRRYSRHVPIEADYIGIHVDTISSEKVRVKWKEENEEDGIWLFTDENNKQE
ncbi:MAG: bifunctional pyr operon transcriptional regulator/uracil phosphoribosyltransferase PyrR [Bacteroidetes bacterium]|nr:MAG: bifunctional pyr operon transcriptional regulator/uracil phosphoribosyltransferase PyrR [Bacteroidota bacterium]REK06945.1 MAG: bifunctional pyr operon transcriptional regulator/uracil phosphoribosyltransferase PyrR [Bacteroidota bacterium]REK33707.1 MAG: bifunctional pyr operon transcriptional regulator/uracil phosphoribosyltransferase PyrR [Bacteroidota bacterium]REK47216.1 MAG: bifunctional pyr operon transcriptional regulator/uracil phosphoribosyltransferase PyrR [Bacteroidota bacter